MDICDRRGLKEAAAEALGRASCNPKKLILIHTGASMAVSLVLSLVDHLLARQIGSTGGLGGIGLRSVLETAQTVLLFGQVAVMLFWQIGYVYASLGISRGEPVGPGSLLQGFRKFGPVLRLRLGLAFSYGGILFLSAYVASLIFTLTPWAAPMKEALELGTEAAMLAAVEASTVPILVTYLLVCGILVVPFHYRLRMVEFLLMDHPEQGAMMAIRKSRLMMHKNRMKLLGLDLSFWWFYGLEILIGAIAYGDMLLPMLGISLPWSETVSFYAFLVLCYVGQLALYWWRGNEVQVTYAMAYRALLPEE